MHLNGFMKETCRTNYELHSHVCVARDMAEERSVTIFYTFTRNIFWLNCGSRSSSEVFIAIIMWWERIYNIFYGFRDINVT